MDNGANNLPSSILGDGRKFVSLLKNYLKGLQDDITEKLGEVTKIYNTVADTPETIDEQVHSITVEEKAVNGNISLLVKWNSDNIKKYAGAVIDIKIGDFHTTLAGFSDQQWVKHYETTKTNQYLVDNIELGQNYLIRVRGKDVYNAKSVEAKAPMVTHYVEPNTYVPKPPYEATVVFDKKGVYWSWKQYDQNEYMWTELRLDEHPGELHNRLEVTTDLMSTEKPYAREGVAYLYNKGVGNSYSQPLKLPYAKAVPHAPANVTVTPTLEGLRIHFDKIPEDCYGANVYINEEKFYTEDNTYNFVCAMGKYSIRVVYLDVFGEGESSTPVEKGTNEQIPPEAVHITNKTVFDDGVIVAKHIGDNAIVGTKIAEGAITTDKISANAITSAKIASNAITSDKILAKAITSDHMEVNSIEGNRIKSSSIDADKLKANSITGDKLVVDSITGDKIKAGSVTVDKLGAGVIDLKELGSAIQGGSVRIDGTGMAVGQNNGSYTKFNESGLIWYDNKGTPYGSVRRMIKGEAFHGDRININWDTTPFVMVTPDVIPIYGTNVSGRLGQEIHCRAINVSNKGFEVEAFTQLEKPTGLIWSKQWDYKEPERTSDIIVWAPYDIFLNFTMREGVLITVNGGDLIGGKSLDIGTGTSEFYLALGGGVSGDYEWKPSGLIKPTGFLRHKGVDYGYSAYSISQRAVEVGKISEKPLSTVRIQLKKGLNFISGFISNSVGSDLPITESLGWIVDAPSFLKFYKPFESPVKFMAIDFPIENYYSIQKNGFKVTTLTGRGAKKFKPKNKRFKVMLIGASSAIGKARPDSAETKFVGGAFNYKTSQMATEVVGINNLEEKRYTVDDYHGSWKYNEQPPETFFASDFGLGFPRGWSLQNTPMKLPGYIANTSTIYAIEASCVDKKTLETDRLKPTFRMLWNDGTRMNKWNDGYFGPGEQILGAPVPDKIQSDSYHGKMGDYHREMHGFISYKMGVSRPTIYEITIPENHQIPEFTVTIGACPEAWIGKKIPITGAGVSRDTSLEIVDTSIFDGGVIIIEEETQLSAS